MNTFIRTRQQKKEKKTAQKTATHTHTHIHSDINDNLRCMQAHTTKWWHYWFSMQPVLRIFVFQSTDDQRLNILVCFRKEVGIGGLRSETLFSSKCSSNYLHAFHISKLTETSYNMMNKQWIQARFDKAVNLWMLTITLAGLELRVGKR